MGDVLFTFDVDAVMVQLKRYVATGVAGPVFVHS